MVRAVSSGQSGTGELLVAVVIADIDPLPAVSGPGLPPAIITVRCVAGKEWCTDEHKIAEMVMPEEEAVPEEEGVTPECEVVESVADETLAGEGCADKAVSPGDEYAPAGDHASAETTASEAAATECITPPPKPPKCIPPPPNPPP
jgi:hypothetical protein